MNILHISPYFPALEANHAGGVCMGKEIETLQKHHQVYILTFVASEFDEKLKKARENDSRYHSVKINGWTRLIHVILEPWMPNYFATRSSLRFAIKLIWLVKTYHIQAIHGEYASMGQYVGFKWLDRHLGFEGGGREVAGQSEVRE